MWAKVMRMLRHGELIGKDRVGNLYYRQYDKLDGALVEKRWVVYNDIPDPKTIPVEWTSWLAGTRKIAPTSDEISHLEEQRRLTKLKATLLQKEEENRRFRAKSLQHSPPDFSDQQSMGSLLKQLSSVDPESGTHTLSKDEPAQMPPSNTSEPTGHQDTFAPGTWKSS